MTPACFYSLSAILIYSFLCLSSIYLSTSTSVHLFNSFFVFLLRSFWYLSQFIYCSLLQRLPEPTYSTRHEYSTHSKRYDPADRGRSIRQFYWLIHSLSFSFSRRCFPLSSFFFVFIYLFFGVCGGYKILFDVYLFLVFFLIWYEVYPKRKWTFSTKNKFIALSTL